MKLTHIALLLSTCTASIVQAEPLVNIPAGAVIECSPSPSIKWLNKSVEFKDGKIASAFVVTCQVPNSQTAPAGSVLIGKLVDGPVPNSYVFQWEMLRVSYTSITWSNAKREQLSTIQGKDGQLHVTFKNSLVVDQTGDVH